MKKIFRFLLIVLSVTSVLNVSALPRTILLSIPKSGTHLLIKCIKLLSDAEFKFTGDSAIPRYIDVCLSNLPSQTVLVSHIPCTPASLSAIRKHQAKVLFIYRDPRDQLVSYAHYIRNNNCSQVPHQAWPMAKNMSFNQIINSLITEKELYHFFPGITGVDGFYKALMPWVHFKGCLVIRFEDLIGSQGGGSQEVQYATIKAIAHYLDIAPLPEEKIRYVMSNLFGGGSAFRLGQIGSWKTTFNKQQKETFNRVAGQLLIDLGYEKDEAWSRTA